MPRWVPVLLIVLGLGVAFAPTEGCQSDGWVLPIPTPIDDTVDPADTEGSWVLIFEETSARTPQTAKLFNQLDAWRKTLEGRGLKFRAYDVDQADNYRSFFESMDLPVLVVIDAAGKVLDKGPLPSTVSELDEFVKKATAR